MSIQIRGGAGPHEAAAIAAVLRHTLASERSGGSQPPARKGQSAWVLSARRPPMAAPIRPATSLTRRATET